jgi:serine/threonine protein kinase
MSRDLKLENIMFDKKPSLPTAEIKIIDFGLATKVREDDKGKIDESYKFLI